MVSASVWFQVYDNFEAKRLNKKSSGYLKLEVRPENLNLNLKRERGQNVRVSPETALSSYNDFFSSLGRREQTTIDSICIGIGYNYTLC